MKKQLIPMLVGLSFAGLAGCDMSKLDPGGGASSRTVVSLRIVKADDAAGTAIPGDGAVTPGATNVASGEPGTLTGTVVFDGTPPSLTPKVGQGQAKVDPTICAKDGAIPDESLVVSSGGGVANVFVYLDKAPKGANPEAVAGRDLDQAACIFQPHAVVWRAGIECVYKNSDKVSHNVQTFASLNSNFNANMPPGSTQSEIWKKPEREPFASKCAIHPWMEFWTLVVDHPFAAVTDAEGKFEIPNLPPGKYKFRVWHERGKLLERGLEVEIKPAQSSSVALKYGATNFGL